MIAGRVRGYRGKERSEFQSLFDGFSQFYRAEYFFRYSLRYSLDTHTPDGAGESKVGHEIGAGCV